MAVPEHLEPAHPLGDRLRTHREPVGHPRVGHPLPVAVRDEHRPPGQLPHRLALAGIRNLQEGRHSLAAAIFHGKKGELYQRYHKGMEDQLGALGLVLNCVVLWNTFYIDAALGQLRAQGQPVADEDIARLSPFVRHHLNVHGKYSFLLPELPGGLRPLGDSESDDGEEHFA